MIVNWCNLCNAQPATGTLTIIDPVTNITTDLDACEQCVSDPEKVEFI